MKMIWIWLGIIIVLILLELASSNFVTLFFAISAFISLILAIFIDSFLIQFLVFLLLGGILLETTRERVIEVVNNKKNKREKDEK